MKKNKIKKLIALTGAVLLMLPLTGCRSLDEMRSKQAFWNGEDRQAISFDGNSYKRLDSCADLRLPTSVNTCYITETDVPVLLSQSMGYRASVSTDHRFISNNDHIYAREDVFDTFQALIQNHPMPYYAAYVIEKNYEVTVRALDASLQQTLQSAIDGMIKTTAFTTGLPEVPIFKCDETGLFYTEAFSLYLDRTTATIYLRDDDDIYRLPDGSALPLSVLFNDNEKYISTDSY